MTPDGACQDVASSASSLSVSTDEKVHQDDHESASSMPVTDENTWTLVSRRRRPRLPPCWKLRFPAHLRHTLKTPSGTDDSEDSEGSVTDCASQTVGDSPTPVAARTRSRAKLKS